MLHKCSQCGHADEIPVYEIPDYRCDDLVYEGGTVRKRVFVVRRHDGEVCVASVPEYELPDFGDPELARVRGFGETPELAAIDCRSKLEKLIGTDQDRARAEARKAAPLKAKATSAK